MIYCDVSKEWLDLSDSYKETLDHALITFVGATNYTISYFIFSQYKVIKISNNPRWMQVFLDHELYKNYNTYKHEINAIPHSNYYFIYRDNLPKNPLLTSAMAKHELHNILSIYIQNETNIEMFGIAHQGSPRVDALSFYLNKYPQILECISHIRNTTQLSKLISTPKYCYHYDNVITNTANYSNFELSPREKECLFMTLQSFSAKQIAQALGLSYRTVEHYMENIKSKTGCKYKSEIVELFQNNNMYSQVIQNSTFLKRLRKF